MCVMSIHDLKRILFSKKTGPEKNNGHRWSDLTQQAKVKYSTINNFTSQHHKIILECTPEYIDKLHVDLKTVARSIIDPEHFQHYWDQCHKPSTTIEIETYAYTKRGHKKIFINMYNDATGEEITGKYTLGQHATVRVYLTWVLVKNDTDGYVQYGWRPFLQKGVRVCTLTSEPFVFKRPWDWSNLNFEDQQVPMHMSYIVKTPALRVAHAENNIVTTSGHLLFDGKMKEFHQAAGCLQWDNKIHVHKHVNRQQLLLASIYPIRNKDTISWHTSKLVVRKAPAVVEAVEPVEADTAVEEDTAVVAVGTKREKRDHDNTDSFFGVKTKRQCKQHDNGDHN